jgi:hypothetical protein
LLRINNRAARNQLTLPRKNFPQNPCRSIPTRAPTRFQPHRAEAKFPVTRLNLRVAWFTDEFALLTTPLARFEAELTVQIGALTSHTDALTVHTKALTRFTVPISVHTGALTAHTTPLTVRTGQISLRTGR